MTRFDVILGKNVVKKEKNKLKLILEEDEDLLKSIEQGMKENNIKSAEVTSINGFLKKGLISSKEEGKKNISEIEIIKANGKFKFGGEDLWGKLEIFSGGKKPLSGQLLIGIATEGLEIIMEY
ncbi:MAG: DUF296 domain-containing protein [Candidatus ainarchaeum sp.]|nr:DUF296 domain-containing protein [Candidatus ainarchaeum sp.]